MIYLRVFLLFSRCIFSYLFSINSLNPSDYYLAGRCLFSLSFRYAERDKKKNTAFFKYFIKAILSPKIFINNSSKIYSDGNHFFFDLYSGSEKQRKLYLNYFLKGEINGAIWKEFLLGHFSFFNKIEQLFFLSLLFLLLTPVLLFTSLPASVGLIFDEYIEVSNLIRIAKKNNVSVLYYFCIYEKDSNIAALALHNSGIQVAKIPSEVPLFFWNKIIISDKLILCDSNQLDELKLYGKTIHIKETEFWGPERCVEVLDRYKSNEVRARANNKVIGFYSTASYIRNLEGNIVQANMIEEEKKIKRLIAKYLIIKKSSKLIIFPHPKEKLEKYSDLVRSHYSNYFNGLNYDISITPEPSSFHFEMAELGISFHSTIIYERLFFGFKCLSFTSPNAQFPIAGTPLSNICTKDEESFYNKVDMFLKFTPDEYFSYTKIKKSPFFQNI